MKLTMVFLLMATIQVFAETKTDNEVKDGQIKLSGKENLSGVKIVPQQRQILTGSVKDQNGEPLIGVTIAIKGTTVGTSTNADGKFTLSGIPKDATLVISYVGMKTQNFVVGNQTAINIIMEADVYSLGEVVAVGYGTRRKSNITGSITKITVSKDLKNRVVPRIDEALQGKMSGVLVQQSSGIPGAAPVIRIRGTRSIT